MKRIIKFLKENFDITLLLSIALVLSKPNDNYILLVLQGIVLTVIVLYWLVRIITIIRNKFKKK